MYTQAPACMSTVSSRTPLHGSLRRVRSTRPRAGDAQDRRGALARAMGFSSSSVLDGPRSARETVDLGLISATAGQPSSGVGHTTRPTVAFDADAHGRTRYEDQPLLSLPRTPPNEALWRLRVRVRDGRHGGPGQGFAGASGRRRERSLRLGCAGLWGTTTVSAQVAAWGSRHRQGQPRTQGARRANDDTAGEVAEDNPPGRSA